MASIANGLVANQEPKTSHCLNWAKGSAWSSVVPCLDDARCVVGIKKVNSWFRWVPSQGPQGSFSSNTPSLNVIRPP